MIRKFRSRDWEKGLLSIEFDDSHIKNTGIYNWEDGTKEKSLLTYDRILRSVKKGYIYEILNPTEQFIFTNDDLYL